MKALTIEQIITACYGYCGHITIQAKNAGVKESKLARDARKYPEYFTVRRVISNPRAKSAVAFTVKAEAKRVEMGLK